MIDFPKNMICLLSPLEQFLNTRLTSVLAFLKNQFKTDIKTFQAINVLHNNFFVLCESSISTLYEWR